MCTVQTGLEKKGAFDWSDLTALDPGPCIRLVGSRSRYLVNPATEPVSQFCRSRGARTF